MSTNYEFNATSSSGAYSHNQWAVFSNRIGYFDNRICHIVASPFFAIATLFSKIYSLSNRIVSWVCCSSSIEDEYQRLVQLHCPLSEDLFVQAKKHPDRNRFSNILPNEPTRFKLSHDPNFYFNANWVLDGCAIASQGPLETEISEFWKMIWHSDTQTLVMLANPIENGQKKCSEYWKANTWFGLKIPHGEFYVQTQSEKTVFEENNVKIIERTIEVSKGSQKKILTQYHLQNWPDFGVVSPAILSELVKLVSKKSLGKNILAHCSAGVGRTGTFLAAYRAFQEHTGNIFPIASNLRNPHKGRVGMIQTPEQYLLASKAAQLLVS